MTQSEFERDVQGHLKPLYCYCLSLTRDPHQAEELAQETLTRAYLAVESLRDASRLWPWLKGIARRCSWTWLRKARRNPLHRAENPGPDIPDGQGTPADRLEKKEKTRAVMKALKKLSRRNHEAVVLRYFEGLSYADMARRLGISVDAVDQRLTRAKCKLHGLLRELEA